VIRAVDPWRASQRRLGCRALVTAGREILAPPGARQHAPSRASRAPARLSAGRAVLEPCLTGDAGGRIGNGEKARGGNSRPALGAYAVLANRNARQGVAQTLRPLRQSRRAEPRQLLTLEILGDIEEVAAGDGHPWYFGARSELCLDAVEFCLQQTSHTVVVLRARRLRR
jgi:hypothetical protein